MLGEVVLWFSGFALLVGVAFYAATRYQKGQSAAHRIIEKRNLKNLHSHVPQQDDVAEDREELALKERGGG